MEQRNVFISYSREDLETAKQIEETLLKMGQAPWRDQESIVAGQQWPKIIGEAIANSDVLLLLWSKSSASSHFVEFEWTTAIALKKTIVPCMLDGTALEPALISFNGVPLDNFEAAFSKILSGVKASASKTAAKRQSEVLKKLQAIAPADPDAMVRMGTMMMQQAGKGGLTGVGAGSVGIGGSSQASVIAVPELQLEGLQIGERYKVIKMLGRGGMGAVYQCHDSELDRDVALKVIRGEIAEDPEVLERFKREIQLSSKVTHRNVLRVYDLGESEGIKFLTMQYVEGENLSGLLRRESPLPMERTLKIFKQICDGLKAAHDEGVLHRDLKPDNVMIDRNDQVYLTDFGLAKSLKQTGFTQDGRVMGTPDYMSPEQVKGEPLDERSDLYSLGTILYEMATGKVPFVGNTIFEVMIQRVQKAPRPATELNPSIPPFLEHVIRRCMATDKEARYANIDELIEDLDRGMGTGKTAFSGRFYLRQAKRFMRMLTVKRLAIAVPVLFLVVLGAVWLVQRGVSPGEAPAGSREPVSVLIADFDNQTGDKLFSGSAEEMLGNSLEGASFVTTFNRGQARKIASQLQGGEAKLDEAMARLVAQREGITVVVSGSIVLDGSTYEVSVKAVDALTGEPIEEDSAETSSKADVLGTLSKLSARIRTTLGDTTPESAQLAAAETYTASSLEAAQALAVGLEFFGEGEFQQAIAQYKSAIELDPGLGRAYAGLAAVYRNYGRLPEAEEQFQLAMRNIDRMSERERYKVRGGYFLVVGNYAKSVEELNSLIQHYPADFVGQINLALSQFLSRNMEAALESARQATKIYPKNVMARSNLALYAMYASDFDTAIKQAEGVLADYPDYADLYLCLALCELAKGSPARAAEHYRKLGGLGADNPQGAWGASLASMGFADIALYEGRLLDAVEVLNQGMAADVQNDDNQAAARKALSLAAAKLALGQKSQADAQARQVIRDQKGASLLYEAGRVFVEGDDLDRAAEVAAELDSGLRPESKLYGNLILGEIELKKGNGADAVRYFGEAQKGSDSWLGRFGLGRAYLQAEAFAEAYSEFELCLERRGEAVAVFLDDVPSFHYFPSVFYYMGRAQEGLQSPGAVQSFRSFLDIRGNARNDPMVEDARKRVGAGK